MASHPTKIGKYNVEGVIGRGGMGVVYKAVDSQIGRYVAIKMITSGGDESLLERFKSEARSTGSLQCPHIVTVYDFGEQEGNPYLVMQYLEGSSLDSMIQKGVSLTISERLGIIIDVCNGLAYAHQRGVIHRDIKPGNIMVLQDGVNDGMAVIVDFGIARIGGDSRLTRTDQIVGSFHYMSAEQLQAKELDNRTDIYATGVVLFQLLTGALPFDSPDTAATLLKIVNEPPPPLSAYLKEYPIELESIVSRALAKKREERYATAKDLAFDLMQVQEHLKSETVALLVRRAEASVGREEWTRAREHLQQVLRIDRQNTNAQKLMNAVQEHLRQQQQIEQARALRSQADEAYMDQRYDDALRLLDQAVPLDSKNADLLAFRDSVRGAKERATGLRRALRRAEAALQDGDLDEARSAVSDAFKIDPSDTQAKALKVIISQHAEERSSQEQLRKLLDQARNQIAARDLTGAFATLKTAEALDPTSNELQSVAKMAASAREQEKRRAETEELSRQIEAALVRGDYATAVAKAEEGLRKFPQEQRLFKLKALAEEQRVRVEKKKFVREQFAAATSLVDSGQLLQALAVLDRALQRAPGDSELEAFRSTVRDRVATEESEPQKPQAVAATLVEGKRILQEGGARSAREFLDTYAVQYSDFPEVRELYDAVRAREALDVLDSKLEAETNPARRVQLAEAAARSNPDNHWIRERLADLQQVRDQISAAIDRARGFEADGHFSDALREWQQLWSSYPQVPELEEQVRRVASLQAESTKSGILASVTAPPVVREPSKADKSAVSLSATRVLDSEVLREGATTRTTPESPKPSVIQAPKKIGPATGKSSPPKSTSPDRSRQKEGFLAGPNKYMAIAVAVVVLVVLGYLIVGGPKKTATVKISTDPADASVTVGTQNCHAPCKLSLPPGTYQLRVERDGYQPVNRQVSIATDMKSLPMVTLTPNPPPPPPPAIDQSTLIVRTNVDDAEVFVDDDRKGVTEHNKYEGKFDVGSHQITLTKSGYKDSQQSVDIVKGRLSNVKIDLQKGEPDFGYIVGTSNAGATVSIDGKVEGRVSRAGRLFQKVAPGTHTIQVSLGGYDSYKGQADVKLGERVLINAILKPTPTLPNPPPPQPLALAPVVSFTPSKSSIQPGESVQLSWQTQNADDVSIDPGIGRVDKSGSRQVELNSRTTYTLTAKGPGGADTRQVTIDVAAPIAKTRITVFKAARTNLQGGQSTELFWATENATAVSIEPGIGNVGPSDTRSVKPSQDTTYTLTATGPGGPVHLSARITVQTQPQPPAQDSDAVRDAIHRYEDAYRTMLVSEVKKEWPSAPKKVLEATKEVFSKFKAPKVQFSCQEIVVNGDSAQCTGSETVTYTEGGKIHNEANPVHVHLKKTGGVWHIDNIS